MRAEYIASQKMKDRSVTRTKASPTELFFSGICKSNEGTQFEVVPVPQGCDPDRVGSAA